MDTPWKQTLTLAALAFQHGETLRTDPELAAARPHLSALAKALAQHGIARKTQDAWHVDQQARCPDHSLIAHAKRAGENAPQTNTPLTEALGKAKTLPTYVPVGNIVDDTADLLVNTVNTVGVMGKGVALAFKNRWPSIIPPYQESCRKGTLQAGDCALFSLPDGRKWAALATKADWRNPSQYTWIESGLQQLANAAKEASVKSIAIPPPGCGNGGLDWKRIEPLVCKSLNHFDLRIYAQPSQRERAGYERS